MENLSVPLLKQGKFDCGPIALKMVLQYFNKDISYNQIIKEIGGIKKYGVKTISLASFAKKLGFKVECYSYNKKLAKKIAKIRKPTKIDIIKFLKRKLPVIITVRSFILFNKKLSEIGHFIVITKYEKGIFCYNDPNDGKQHKIRENDLMFAWFNNVLDSSAYLLVLQPKH